MSHTKGFSLLEFMVVVALIGVLSIFIYTPKTTRWNTELSAAQSQIISFLKYYQKKSMRDGHMYYVKMNLDTTDSIFFLEAFVDTNVTTRQSNCTASNNITFSERRVFDQLENIRAIGCVRGGTQCANPSSSIIGICFFPHGSSAATNSRTEWYISHTNGDNTTHATNAYKFDIWKTTSFIETYTCKGDADYNDISSTNIPCTTAQWIEE